MSTHDALLDRLAELEATVSSLQTTVNRLETKTQTLETENDRLRSQLEQTTSELNAKTDALTKKSQYNKDRVEELQARELEKGAHLQTEHVDTRTIDVPNNRLEKLAKDDGLTYYRLPEQEDPLDRTSTTQLAYGDLLPIQQLARLDEEMLRSTTSALPTRLAAKLWKARADPTIGDNPWERGSKTIKEYIKASDLKHWIRRQEKGVSDSYAKKLVSRTIDALLDLTKNRVAIRRKKERKNGLAYTERRLIIPSETAIPGERSNLTRSTADTEADSDRATQKPETAGVHG